jgi:hypothetical protein
VTRGNWPECRFPLPGGWLNADGSTECRRYHSAVLRTLTGYEEAWLAQHRDVPNAIKTTRLLTACVLNLDDDEPPPDMARRMLVGDRDYLMLQLRRLTFGDRILAIVDCPACEARMNADFNASAIAIEAGAAHEASYEIEIPESAGNVDRAIRFRLPTGADQEAVLGLDVEAGADKLLERCFLTGVAEPLAMEQKAQVITAMEERAPRIDLELELVCPECSHAFATPFDTTAFFLDELRATTGQLFREIHFLAFYYHWKEREILSLARDRRRAYLSFLSDTLRQE